MLIISAWVTAVASGFLLGWLSRFPLFALTALTISCLVSAFGYVNSFSWPAVIGFFFITLVGSQIGYFAGAYAMHLRRPKPKAADARPKSSSMAERVGALDRTQRR